MSVDSLREKFHMNWVEADNLSDFLTAQSYRPEITETLEKIKSFESWKHLQELCVEPIRQGVSPDYTENGYPCLKSKHTINLIVDKYKYDSVTNEFAAQKEQLKVKDEDLLITRSGAGTIGRAAIFFGDEAPVTNEHLFKVRISSSDSAFVASYLRSYYGERLLEYGISGSTGQLNLSNLHIKWLPVIQPAKLVQTYIGNKIRQAELLRELAVRKSSVLIKYFNSLLPSLDHKSNINKIVPNDICNRLDPKFYSKAQLALERFLSLSNIKATPLSDLIDGSYSGAAIPSGQFDKLGVSVVQTKDISVSGIVKENCLCISTDTATEFDKFRASEGTLLMGMSGTIGRSCVVLDTNNEYIVNQRVAALNFTDLGLACYTSAYINHDLGKMQLKRYTVGGVQGNISLGDILKTKVVLPEPAAVEQLGSLQHTSLIARDYAKSLIKSARILVEELIAGHITETDMIEAQKSLESDNNTKDKAILSKLTDKGYAAKDGEPLLSDLDVLYDLLEEAKLTEKEKEQW